MNPVEERFLESLLEEAYHPTDVEPILSRALACINDRPQVVPVQSTPYARRQWFSAIGTIIAACLVICLLAVWPSESSATEVLQEVIANTEARVDREYRIETTGRVKLKATLWVNGGDRFVLRLPAIVPVIDYYVWVGCNGADFWIVPAVGPVLVNRQADWLLAQLQRHHQVALPLLHLSAVTRRLESRYTAPRLVNDIPGMKHLVIEQKQPGSELLPVRVEIIAQAGIIQSLLLHWDPKHSGEEPFDMTLTLVQQTTKPGDWYEHAAHHAATRRVLPAQEDDPR